MILMFVGNEGTISGIKRTNIEITSGLPHTFVAIVYPFVLYIICFTFRERESMKKNEVLVHNKERDYQQFTVLRCCVRLQRSRVRNLAT